MGVRAIYQIFTPYNGNQIHDVQYEQVADVMVLTHLDHPPMQLTRYGHARWTFAPAVYSSKAWAPENLQSSNHTPETGTGFVSTAYYYIVTTIDAETGMESMPTGVTTQNSDLTLKGNTITLTWDARSGAERYNIYKRQGGAWGYIGTTEDTAFTDDNIAPDFSQSYPRHNNPFPGAGHYPATVTFWQQRAVYGRTYAKPNAVLMSQSGNLFNFNYSRPIIDSDSITLAAAGRRVNAVLHLVPMKNLIVFTTDTIFSISGGEGPITPTNIMISHESYQTSSRVRPAVSDEVIFFSAAKGAAIRTLGYTFEADGYKGNDLTVYAPHLFRNITTRELSFAPFPHSVLHCVGSDGDIRMLTWQQEQQIWGWSLVSTQGEIESVCTVSELGEDRTYVVVRRQLPGLGGDVRTLEYFASPRWTDVKRSIYVDCARQYDGPPITEMTGLYYLEGKKVSVLADGQASIEKYEVKEGKIKLQRPASVVTVGLPYESWVRTLPPNFTSDEGGTNKGKPKILAGFNVSVLRTRGIEAGHGKNMPPGEELPTGHDNPWVSDHEIRGDAYELKTRSNEPMGTPTELFSGDLWAPLEASDWKTADVVIRQRYPLPMHITNIVPDVIVGG